VLHRDRAIGVLLGLLIGIAIVIVFVFVFSGETIDEPSISGSEQQIDREAEQPPPPEGTQTAPP
jgi:beta-lactam-binding protein with PASTA domain